MDKRTLLLVAGFLTFTIGFLAVIMRLIGGQFIFLAWMDSFGPLVAFVLQILMVIVGIVMAMWSRIDFDKEDGLY